MNVEDMTYEEALLYLADMDEEHLTDPNNLFLKCGIKVAKEFVAKLGLAKNEGITA